MCDDKETIERWNLLKITKIYEGLLKFMTNIAVLLKSGLTSAVMLLLLCVVLLVIPLDVVPQTDSFFFLQFLPVLLYHFKGGIG